MSTFAKVRASKTVFCSCKNCIPHFHVHNRYVTLPDITLAALRRYWSTHRNPCFLFPLGKTSQERHKAKKHMDRGGLQKSFQAIIQSCNIHKRITIHNLRHCCGTHLVEVGLNLRAIQELLGHESPKTTVLSLVD